FDLPVTGIEQGVVVNLAVVRGNVVLVDHGRSLPPLPLPAKNRLTGRQTLNLAGVTHREEVTALLNSDAPASALLAQDTRRARPILCVDGEDPAGAQAVWEPAPDLIAADGKTRAFVLETDNDGRPSLRFGDDVRGSVPRGSLSLRCR